MRAPVVIGLFALFALLAAPAAAEARTLRGKVAKVLDGDTVRVDLGARTRTFHLAGLDAPEMRGSAGERCFGRQARGRLGRLLRRGARVWVRVVGRRTAELRRGRVNVNRTMVSKGYARATSGGGRLGSRLRKAEARARARGLGLHVACAGEPGAPLPGGGGTPPPPASGGPAPAPGDVTGAGAIAELTSNLTGMAFQRSSSSGDTTTNTQLHLCAGEEFRYWTQESYTSGDVSFNPRHETLGRPWRVTDALVKADGSRAAVVQGTVLSEATNDGPRPVTQPQSSVRIDFAGGQWYLDGQAVLAFPGQASCAPLLAHG